MVEIRHTPKVSWPAIVDKQGVRVLIAPVETDGDDKKTGDTTEFTLSYLPSVAQQMLKSKGSIPTLYFRHDITQVEFGWLAPWEEWIAGRVDALTYGDCESWLQVCCHEFIQEHPMDLIDLIHTSVEFCASAQGAALPAWVAKTASPAPPLDRSSKFLERMAAVVQAVIEGSAVEIPPIGEREAQERLQKLFLENAQRLGRFIES